MYRDHPILRVTWLYTGHARNPKYRGQSGVQVAPVRFARPTCRSRPTKHQIHPNSTQTIVPRVHCQKERCSFRLHTVLKTDFPRLHNLQQSGYLGPKSPTAGTTSTAFAVQQPWRIRQSQKSTWRKLIRHTVVSATWRSDTQASIHAPKSLIDLEKRGSFVSRERLGKFPARNIPIYRKIFPGYPGH